MSTDETAETHETPETPETSETSEDALGELLSGPSTKELAEVSLEGLHNWWGELKQSENRSNDLAERRKLQQQQAVLLAEIERRVVAMSVPRAQIVEPPPIPLSRRVLGLG